MNSPAKDRRLHHFIDLHSHILFGIDDGPDEIEQSLALAESYAEAGYRVVVATPHRHGCLAGKDVRARIQRNLQTLNRAIAEQGLELTVLPGMEVVLSPDILDGLRSGAIFTIGGGHFVLIETPFEQFPLGWEQCLFQIVAGGYSVLLAHPERCRQLMRRPEMFDVLAEMGVCLQVNCDSLLGSWGKSAQNLAHRLLAEGRVHCLATDSHDAVKRSPMSLRKVFDAFGAVYGAQTLVRLAAENPQRVLDRRPLLAVEPAEAVEPSVFDRATRFWRSARKMMAG